MKKKIITFGLIGIVSLSLVGCSAQPLHLYFEGKQMRSDRIEEIIEDRLEDENGIELEVDIYEEIED